MTTNPKGDRASVSVRYAFTGSSAAAQGKARWKLALKGTLGGATSQDAILDIRIAGLGSGEVEVVGLGLRCDTDCSKTFVAGDEVTLTASSSTGSTSTSWEGCDFSAGPECQLTKNRDRSVTASFGLLMSQAPVVSVPATSNGQFTVSISYDWPPLASSEDRFELEESTTSASSEFAPIHASYDRESPHLVPLSRAAGIYYYRARVYAGFGPSPGYSPYSAVTQHVVASAPRRIRLLNQAVSGRSLDSVVQFRVASTRKGVFTKADLLTPDSMQCLGLPGEEVTIGGSSRLFEITTGPDYYVFLGFGNQLSLLLSLVQTQILHGSELLFPLRIDSGNGLGSRLGRVALDSLRRLPERGRRGDAVRRLADWIHRDGLPTRSRERTSIRLGLGDPDLYCPARGGSLMPCVGARARPSTQSATSTWRRCQPMARASFVKSAWVRYLASRAAIVFVAAMLAAAGNAGDLLTNGDFNSDLSGWLLPSHPTFEYSVTWDPNDLDGAPGSGSVRWESNGYTRDNAIEQCVDLLPGFARVHAWALVPAGQVDKPAPTLRFSSYREPSCAAGTRSGYWTTDPVVEVGSWTLLEIEQNDLPTDTRSVGVELRLGLAEVPSAPAVAFFDGVSLVAPEPAQVLLVLTGGFVLAVARRRRPA